MDAIRAIAEASGTIVIVLFGFIAVKLFRDLIWKPYAFHKVFARQGISGPAYHVLAGSIPEHTDLLKEAQKLPMQEICHDIVPRVVPHHHKWSCKYGETFMYWDGIHPRLYIAEPELIKEILSDKFGHYRKRAPRPLMRALFGQGLLFVSGLEWVKHRRIVSPAFNVHNLKTMVKRMAACTSSMLEDWQAALAQTDNFTAEIDVHAEFIAVTSDIIAYIAFGSGFSEGKEVFYLQRQLQYLAAQAERTVFVPGSQYIPTRKNRYAWRLDRRVKQILHSIVQSRLHSTEAGRTDTGYGNDLLGLMMAANKNELGGNHANLSMTVEEIMDECKTFLFAGHETTSTLLTWTVFLLAIHTEWQNSLREEVISVCGTEIPDAEMLSRLKSMSMVLKESLRLYPPAFIMVRKADKEMKVGDFTLPKGAAVTLPVLAVHHSEKFWGADANQFKPERFGEGAIQPNAYIPFSTGPRVCVGQNFAMLEAKTVLALILQRFSFTLSPSYRHAPIGMLTLQPQYGMPILFQGIQLVKP